MKNLFFKFILISPLLFFTACEETDEVDEVCTGDVTADLVVGTWESNSVFFYYPNGDPYGCINFCNSSNSLCSDMECTTSTYNCDGTTSYSTGDVGTWSYDPETELHTEIGPNGTIHSSFTTLNSVHAVTEAEIFLIDVNGNQINLTAISSSTRIN